MTYAHILMELFSFYFINWQQYNRVNTITVFSVPNANWEDNSNFFLLVISYDYLRLIFFQ